ITLDNASINFVHLSSSTNTTTAVNVAITLPVSAQATLQAGGPLTNQISGSGFATTVFPDPSSTFAITTNDGFSQVKLSGMDANFNPPTETLSGLANDTYQLQSSVAIPSGAVLTVNVASFDVHGTSIVFGALAGSGTVTNAATTPATLTVSSASA